MSPDAADLAFAPLVFGDAQAEPEVDATAFTERLATVIPTLRDCAPIGPADDFRQKSSMITINGLKLIAAASTPVYVDVGDTDDHTLLMPYAGEADIGIDGVEHHWEAGQRALYYPGGARRGPAAPRSVLIMDIQPSRLQLVARAMLGLEPDAHVEFMLGRSRAIELHQGGIAFDNVFRQLCSLIDAYHGDPESLAVLGVDDQFYRHAVMMLRPGLQQDEVQRKPSRQARVLDPLCEYIVSRLHLPLSLTDLEVASGLSRRSLQYAFWQRYRCSPMQWLRARRLDKARTMLLAGDTGESVTSVAMQSGFGNLGAFAAQYRERFGEQPSETLRRH